MVAWIVPVSETDRPGTAKRDYKGAAAGGLRSGIPRLIPLRLGDLDAWRSDIRERRTNSIVKKLRPCAAAVGDPAIAPWYARAPRECEALCAVSEARDTMKSLYSPQRTLVTQGSV